jgi:hypothetical protein
LELFEDEGQGNFVGKLTSFSPPIPQQNYGTTPGCYMEQTVDEQIRSADGNSLLELCKKRISELGGEIITFAEE